MQHQLFLIIVCHCLVIQTSTNPITDKTWDTGKRLLSIDGAPSQDVMFSKSSVIQEGKYYSGSSNEGDDIRHKRRNGGEDRLDVNEGGELKRKRRNVGDSLDVEEGDDKKIRSNMYLNAEHNPHIKEGSHVNDRTLIDNARDRQLLNEDGKDRRYEDGRGRETSGYHGGYDNDDGDDGGGDYGDNKSVSSSASEVRSRSIPFDDDDDEWEDDDDDETDTSEEYKAKGLPFDDDDVSGYDFDGDDEDDETDTSEENRTRGMPFDDDDVSGYDFDGDDEDDETDTSEENRTRGMPFDDDDIHEEAYYEDD